MIRFFSNLRKEHMKFKSYLLYALGEILLVVIGILIALAINNRNSDVDKNNQFEKAFSQLHTNMYCEIAFNEHQLSLLKKKLETALIEFNDADTITGLAVPNRLIYLNSNEIQYNSNSSYILNHLQENIVDQDQNQIMNQIGSYYSVFKTWDELIKDADVGYFDELFKKYSLQQPSEFTTTEFTNADIQKAIRIRQDPGYKTQLRSTINKLNDLIYLVDYKINESIAVQEYILNQKDPPILNFEHVGIVGTALPSGWKKSVPMQLIDKEEAIWRLQIELQDGEIKFRNGNNWNQNWGASSAFDGNASFFGRNIPVQHGYYEITLNIKDKKYSIEKITGPNNGSNSIGG